LPFYFCQYRKLQRKYERLNAAESYAIESGGETRSAIPAKLHDTLHRVPLLPRDVHNDKKETTGRTDDRCNVIKSPGELIDGDTSSDTGY